jgi:Dehydrogenases with different specificities (related to short-chain alcohol dehydrogenases)
MNYDLQDKVVAITGGTSGIGEALAYAMVEQGAKVVVCGRNVTKINEINALAVEKGYDLLAVRADVSKVAEIKALADAAVMKFDTIDVWVNNAGINIMSPFNKITEEQFQQVIDINFKSYWYGAAIASDIMKAQKKKGVIINTSSFNEHMPSAEKAIYCATKSAIGSITRVFAVELGKFDIRVVSVSPGYTLTPINQKEIGTDFDRLVAAIPVRRFASTDDMVAAYLFLASDASNYINGVDIRVDGAKFGTQNPQWSWTYEGDL